MDRLTYVALVADYRAGSAERRLPTHSSPFKAGRWLGSRCNHIAVEATLQVLLAADKESKMTRRHGPENLGDIRDFLQQWARRGFVRARSIIDNPRARHGDQLKAAELIASWAYGKPRQMDAKLAEYVSPEERTRREADRQLLTQMMNDYEKALRGQSGAGKFELLALENRIRQQDAKIAELEAELAARSLSS